MCGIRNLDISPSNRHRFCPGKLVSEALSPVLMPVSSGVLSCCSPSRQPLTDQESQRSLWTPNASALMGTLSTRRLREPQTATGDILGLVEFMNHLPAPRLTLLLLFCFL